VFFQILDRRIPWLTQAEAILPICIVRGRSISSLPDHVVNISGFGGEDAGVLELDPVAQAIAVFSSSS
jgi:hypothetical protein